MASSAKSALRCASVLFQPAARTAIRQRQPICRRCVSSRPDLPKTTPAPAPAPIEEEPVRLLSEVDYKGKQLQRPKPGQKKDPLAGLWYPRTRFVLGIILIGVIIYDMVSFQTMHSLIARLILLAANQLIRSRTSRRTSRATSPVRARLIGETRIWRDINIAHAITHGGLHKRATAEDHCGTGED